MCLPALERKGSPVIGTLSQPWHFQRFASFAGVGPPSCQDPLATAGKHEITGVNRKLQILAVLAEAETAAACLDAAEAAARSVGGASIEALHIIVDPRSLATASEEISFQHLREVYEGTPDERAAAVRAAFRRWIKFHPTADIPFSFARGWSPPHNRRRG